MVGRRVGRVVLLQFLCERPLRRVGVPGGHPPHLSVLVLDVDEAQVGENRHGHLRQSLDHVAIVGHLGKHLGRQEQEFVAPASLEQFFDQVLALVRLGRGMQQFAKMVADRVHHLDNGGVGLARAAAEHLHDTHAGAPVADGKGVCALQPVVHERLGPEARVVLRDRRPTSVAVFDHQPGQPFAPAGRIRLLLLRERRARSWVCVSTRAGTPALASGRGPRGS